MDVLGDRPASIRAIGMPVCFETSMAVFRLVVTSSLGSITTSRSSSGVTFGSSWLQSSPKSTFSAFPKGGVVASHLPRLADQPP